MAASAKALAAIFLTPGPFPAARLHLVVSMYVTDSLGELREGAGV